MYGNGAHQSFSANSPKHFTLSKYIHKMYYSLRSVSNMLCSLLVCLYILTLVPLIRSQSFQIPINGFANSGNPPQITGMWENPGVAWGMASPGGFAFSYLDSGVLTMVAGAGQSYNCSATLGEFTALYEKRLFFYNGTQRVNPDKGSIQTLVPCENDFANLTSWAWLNGESKATCPPISQSATEGGVILTKLLDSGLPDYSSDPCPSPNALPELNTFPDTTVSEDTTEQLLSVYPALPNRGAPAMVMGVWRSLPASDPRFEGQPIIGIHTVEGASGVLFQNDNIALRLEAFHSYECLDATSFRMVQQTYLNYPNGTQTVSAACAYYSWDGVEQILSIKFNEVPGECPQENLIGAVLRVLQAELDPQNPVVRKCLPPASGPFSSALSGHALCLMILYLMTSYL